MTLKTRVAVPLLILMVTSSAFVFTRQATFRGRWFLEAPSYVTSFQPCGTHERWLAVLDSSLLAGSETETTMVFMANSPDSALPDSVSALVLPPPTFVLVRGDTSPRGSYGADGEFSRRLLVHDVDSLPTSERPRCR